MATYGNRDGAGTKLMGSNSGKSKRSFSSPKSPEWFLGSISYQPSFRWASGLLHGGSATYRELC